MNPDDVDVTCNDCLKAIPRYQTEVVEEVDGLSPQRACADCYERNWRPCCLCSATIRIRSYNGNPDDFEVDAIWRDSELLDDGTYLDYMCRTCIEKLKPALDFFVGADKEMIRKCREFLSE